MGLGLTDIGTGTERFLHWWRAELVGFVPVAVRDRLAPASGRLVASVHGGQVSLTVAAGRSTRALGDALDVDGLDTEVLRALIGPEDRKLPVTLALGPDLAIRQMADLPLAAEATLHDVVGFEMDRLTPFERDDVHYVCRVVGRDKAAQKLRAEIVFSPRKPVSELLTRFEALGLPVDRVDLAGPTPGETRGFSLLGTTARRRRFGIGMATFAGLSACLLGVLGAGVWTDLADRHAAAETVRRQLAVARADMADRERMERDLTLLEGAGVRVLRRRIEEPLAVEILEDVTRTLPDDAWLLSFRLTDERVEISGFAAQSSDLIALFERAPEFTGVTFSTPIVQASKSGLEKFTLSLKRVREDRP